MLLPVPEKTGGQRALLYLGTQERADSIEEGGGLVPGRDSGQQDGLPTASEGGLGPLSPRPGACSSGVKGEGLVTEVTVVTGPSGRPGGTRLREQCVGSVWDLRAAAMVGPDRSPGTGGEEGGVGGPCRVAQVLLLGFCLRQFQWSFGPSFLGAL